MCIRHLIPYKSLPILPMSPITSITFLDVDCYNGIELDDAELFVPPITLGKVVKIIDGNAILVVSKLPYPTSKLYQFMIRLKNVDNCSDDSSSECESNKKGVLSNFILGKVVGLQDLEYCGEDLYGYVYYDYVCINTFMVLNRRKFLE